MKRRGALKFIGLVGLVVLTASFITSCSNPKSEQVALIEETAPAEEIVVQSERDQLIINREVMKFEDSENPTDFELKHTPEITLGEKGPKGFTQINVSIGQSGIIHPVEDNHWVDFITLYADDKKVGHIEYEAGMSRGFASFYIQLEGIQEIKAEAGCNLHGIWQSAFSL